MSAVSFRRNAANAESPICLRAQAVGRLERVQPFAQRGPRQLADAQPGQPAVGVQEQRGGQPAVAERAGLALAVPQHVAQAGRVVAQVVGDGPRRLALVQEHEMHVGMPGLRLLEHRHLAPARRAPAGPQVHHCGLATKNRQRGRRALQVAQDQFGERGMRLRRRRRDQRASAQPDQAGHGQRRQREAPWRAPAQDRRQGIGPGGRQPDQAVPAAVAQVQHGQRFRQIGVAVLPEIAQPCGESRPQSSAFHKVLRALAASAADVSLRTRRRRASSAGQQAERGRQQQHAEFNRKDQGPRRIAGVMRCVRRGGREPGRQA